MHLSDSVLRKCNKETIGVGLSLKLESLYEKISHELDLFDGETNWVQDAGGQESWWEPQWIYQVGY